MGKEKFVLLYSGGLDTSVMIPWLKENYECDVIACCVDVGQGSEVDSVKRRAMESGAIEAHVLDVREEFVNEYVFPMYKSGAIYEGKYHLGTAIARPLIAKKVAEMALEKGATAVVHGCTGKGNDQVRFELTFKALAPELRIIAPWRFWEIRSRDEELEYAKKHNIEFPLKKEESYSMDRNILHLSHEGLDLEDPWNIHKQDMYQMGVAPEDAPDKATIIEIGFEKGVPVSIDGVKMSGLELMEKLNELGGANGVGVTDLVENRLVGIKCRGVYETPGGTILKEAHDDLETITLDKETMHLKSILAQKYAELIYNGYWFSTVREAIDAFINVTQETVTGTVRIKLYKGNASAVGRKSPYSLYREDFATFGEDEVYNQSDAEGFINLFGLQLKVKALLDLNLKRGKETEDMSSDDVQHLDAVPKKRD